MLLRRRIKDDAKAAANVRELAEDRERALQQLAKHHILVNPDNLRPTTIYDTPDFVRRGHYIDRPFNCKTCAVPQVWTETQQKWWYESAKGDVWTIAVLCRSCRRREQARRTLARATHLAGMTAKAEQAG